MSTSGMSWVLSCRLPPVDVTASGMPCPDSHRAPETPTHMTLEAPMPAVGAEIRAYRHVDDFAATYVAGLLSVRCRHGSRMSRDGRRSR